jgi:hypothetical protein
MPCMQLLIKGGEVKPNKFEYLNLLATMHHSCICIYAEFDLAPIELY